MNPASIKNFQWGDKKTSPWSSKLLRRVNQDLKLTNLSWYLNDLEAFHDYLLFFILQLQVLHFFGGPPRFLNHGNAQVFISLIGKLSQCDFTSRSFFFFFNGSEHIRLVPSLGPGWVL